MITATSDFGWESIGTLWAGADQIFADDRMQSLYQKSELVLACVRELENAVAEGQIQLGRYNENNEWESVDNADFYRLFYENEDFSYSEIIKFMVSRLSLTGIGYTLLDRFENRRGIGALIPTPTHVIKAVKKGPKITAYKLDMGDGATKTLEVNEVSAVMYRDPNCWNGYVSPLKAASQRCVIDREQSELTAELMHNRNYPGQMYSTEQPMTPDAINHVRDQLRENTGREGKNRGNDIILPSGLHVGDQVRVDDIDFSELSMLNETRICMVFQVPPILIGSKAGLERSTYSNYESARKSFYKETIASLWKMLSSVLTRDLLFREGVTDLQVRFDTTNIEALQEDKNEISTRATNLFTGGIISRDEARRMVGFTNDEEVEEEEVETQLGDVEVLEEKVLNGAQVTAATGIIEKVAQKLLPRDSAVGQLRIMFNLTLEQAEAMLGSVGTTFTVDIAEPTNEPPPENITPINEEEVQTADKAVNFQTRITPI